jgi:hypothetical protein
MRRAGLAACGPWRPEGPGDARTTLAVLEFRFADKFGKLSAGAKRGNSKRS